MDIQAFGEFKTGQLIPIRPDDRFDDDAFCPNALPPQWEPDGSLWALIADARDHVGKLDAFASILPNASFLLRPLQKREALTSNSIEGTVVSPKQLLLFEAKEEPNQPMEENDERLNDWKEVLAYESALDLGCKLISEGARLDADLFLRVHERLLRTVRGRDKSPGEFRKVQVYVGSSRRYIPPPPERVDGLVRNLEEYLASDHGDPLVRAFIAHYQFEALHPFADGNGRSGRLLLSLCIHKWLKHSHAWLYLSEYFDRNRGEYIRRMFAVSAEGEWDEWVRFCLLGTIEQADAAVATCKKMEGLKRAYELKVGHLSSRMNAIVSKLFANPFIEVIQIRKEFDIAYNTAKADIQKLLDAGIVVPLSLGRKTYFAAEIFNIAYENQG